MSLLVRHSPTALYLLLSTSALLSLLETTVTLLRALVRGCLVTKAIEANRLLGMSAVVYGLMTYLLCITMGYNGLGISIARDIGPRLIAWWVGYGKEVFAGGFWLYGPIGAGLSGSLAGALIYDVFIFVGGESPVNYNWPRAGDIKWRVNARKEDVKNKIQNLEV